MNPPNRPDVNVVSRLRPGIPASVGGPGAEVERQHVDLVLEEAEPEVGEQRRGERLVDPDRQALVDDVGHAAQAHQFLPAPVAERGRPVAQEIADAVSGEHVEVVGQPAIQTDVERVLREGLRAARDEIVPRPVVPPGGVRLRNQGQQRLRLRRQPPRGMTLPGNCWPVAGSKMFTPYALRLPLRAAAVGTVSSFEPPWVLRVP